MKCIFALLAALMAAVLLPGCGEKDSFTIMGTVEGAEAQSVTLTYYAGGGLKTVTMPMSRGQFRFVGQSAKPTLATLNVAVDNMRLADVVVRNGDVVKIEAKIDDPYATKVTGNSDSESVQKWLSDHSDLLKGRDARRINQAIADYVGRNRDRLSATALMVSCFQSGGFESMADSLFSLLAPEVRTQEMTRNYNAVVSSYVGSVSTDPLPFLTLYSRNDSLVNVNPLRHRATLLCFVDADRRQRDSIVRVLRDLSGHYERPELAAVELSTAADSAEWRRSIGSDSAKWVQTWLPGSVASAPVRKLDVTRVPFFIVADSAGRPLYRGASVSEARRKVEGYLK